jgi:hypothetical protein
VLGLISYGLDKIACMLIPLLRLISKREKPQTSRSRSCETTALVADDARLLVATFQDLKYASFILKPLFLRISIILSKLSPYDMHSTLTFPSLHHTQPVLAYVVLICSIK